ncbi:TPA: hypothetical protein JG866_003666 [Enterobacter hormaechei subsp. steigerwaltii]|uniref:hypothetical protein n=1 Tax=Escherichia TaxID=561 RepID=UPI001080E627|nr:hypothetical protein [Escherichia sp. E4736]TGB62926.1 hypothetical protein CQB02_19515 [Escherichia coli]TLI90602.1 hypothetical protein FEK46_18970 [Escherichia sp. E4736]HAV1485119.1 hypothetical protein [Enterobacter hormaechei subsp. steigerwaltii]
MFNSYNPVLDDSQEILANLLGLPEINFEIQYHSPSSNGLPIEQWFKNHYKKVALHVMDQAIYRKNVRNKACKIALANVISRSVPFKTHTSRAHRSSTKSAKGSFSTGSSEGGDPEPASVLRSSSLFSILSLNASYLLNKACVLPIASFAHVFISGVAS